MNKRTKYDKTSKSKDIIIMAKDKEIGELEEENKKLKDQLEILRVSCMKKCKYTITLYYDVIQIN